MARHNRLQTPDLVRHVMSRGNARMAIFLDERDYREFVHLLGEVAASFQLRCWNYCLMPNHYHLTLQPTQPNLSEAIRILNSQYAQWWNRRHGRVGHVFQGRFKDQIVDRDEYMHALSRYVVLNPVRAKLVQRPEEWPWSSYRATIGACQMPMFLASDLTLALFGHQDVITLRARFVTAMTAGIEDEGRLERIRSKDRILGGPEFKERVLAALARS